VTSDPSYYRDDAIGKSIDVIIDAFSALADDAQCDQEFKDWFKKVDMYIHKVIRHAYKYTYLLKLVSTSGSPPTLVSSSNQRATLKATNLSIVNTSIITSTRGTLTACSILLGTGSSYER
jgi:hypothetical protein